MQEIIPIGFLSGFLFVVATGSSFVAVSRLGSVAVATGIWSGTAMCTSFFSGLILGERLNLGLSNTAIAFMLFSVYRLSQTARLSGCASRYVSLLLAHMHESTTVITKGGNGGYNVPCNQEVRHSPRTSMLTGTPPQLLETWRTRCCKIQKQLVILLQDFRLLCLLDLLGA